MQSVKDYSKDYFFRELNKFHFYNGTPLGKWALVAIHTQGLSQELEIGFVNGVFSVYCPDSEDWKPYGSSRREKNFLGFVSDMVSKNVEQCKRYQNMTWVRDYLSLNLNTKEERIRHVIKLIYDLSKESPSFTQACEVVLSTDPSIFSEFSLYADAAEKNQSETGQREHEQQTSSDEGASHEPPQNSEDYATESDDEGGCKAALSGDAEAEHAELEHVDRGDHDDAKTPPSKSQDTPPADSKKRKPKQDEDYSPSGEGSSDDENGQEISMRASLRGTKRSRTLEDDNSEDEGVDTENSVQSLSTLTFKSAISSLAQSLRCEDLLLQRGAPQHPEPAKVFQAETVQVIREIEAAKQSLRGLSCSCTEYIAGLLKPDVREKLDYGRLNFQVSCALELLGIHISGIARASILSLPMGGGKTICSIIAALLRLKPDFETQATEAMRQLKPDFDTQAIQAQQEDANRVVVLVNSGNLIQQWKDAAEMFVPECIKAVTAYCRQEIHPRVDEAWDLALKYPRRAIVFITLVPSATDSRINKFSAGAYFIDEFPETGLKDPNSTVSSQLRSLLKPPTGPDPLVCYISGSAFSGVLSEKLCSFLIFALQIQKLTEEMTKKPDVAGALIAHCTISRVYEKQEGVDTKRVPTPVIYKTILPPRGTGIVDARCVRFAQNSVDGEGCYPIEMVLWAIRWLLERSEETLGAVLFLDDNSGVQQLKHQLLESWKDTEVFALCGLMTQPERSREIERIKALAESGIKKSAICISTHKQAAVGAQFLAECYPDGKPVFHFMVLPGGHTIAADFHQMIARLARLPNTECRAVLFIVGLDENLADKADAKRERNNERSLWTSNGANLKTKERPKLIGCKTADELAVWMALAYQCAQGGGPGCESPPVFSTLQIEVHSESKVPTIRTIQERKRLLSKIQHECSKTEDEPISNQDELIERKRISKEDADKLFGDDISMD